MSDNRTLAKGVMVGGVPVYNNVESTTDTTMPSTSFFKTEDVDGKPVIISRDNIMGIVKDCLGNILNGLTDQTTVTKVPTLNGDTLGASAVSTLASVLGATIGGAGFSIPVVNNLGTKATSWTAFANGIYLSDNAGYIGLPTEIFGGSQILFIKLGLCGVAFGLDNLQIAVKSDETGWTRLTNV